jgi:hypothetical protein
MAAAQEAPAARRLRPKQGPQLAQGEGANFVKGTGQTVDMFARENEMGGYGTLQQECGILGCLLRSFTLPF